MSTHLLELHLLSNDFPKDIEWEENGVEEETEIANEYDEWLLDCHFEWFGGKVDGKKNKFRNRAHI